MKEAVPVIQERLFSFNTTLAFTETVKGLYDRQRILGDISPYFLKQ